MPRQTAAAPMDALAKTIEQGDQQRMKALLEAFREKGGTRLPQWIGDRRLIHEAARRGQLEMVQLLADWEDVSVIDKFHRSALMFAARDGHLEIVRFLAEQEKKQDSDSAGGPAENIHSMRDKYGQSAAEFALDGGNLEVLRHLASLAPLPLAADGGTLLCLAIAIREKECALFLADECDLAHEKAGGWTALALSIQENWRDVAEKIAGRAGHGLGKGGASQLGSPERIAAYAAFVGATACLPLFLPAFDWRWRGEGGGGENHDVWGLALRSSAPAAQKSQCLSLLQEAAPLSLARSVLERHGADVLPLLFARVEEHELRAEMTAGKIAKAPKLAPATPRPKKERRL